MYESSQSTSPECENCGAILPPPDASGHRTCQYCGATYTPPAAATTSHQVNIVVNGTPMPDLSDFQPINADAVKKAAGCGTGVVVFIILITIASVAIPLYFAFGGSGGFGSMFDTLGSLGGGSGVDATPSFAFLPAEPSGPAPYVALVTHYDSGQSKVVHQIAKVDGKDGKAQWMSPGLDSTDRERPLLSDGTHVLLPDGRRVVAVNLSDGSLAWQAGLSDEFRTWRVNDGSCPGCFALNGTQLAVVTADGVLQSFDTTNGKATWSHRMTDVNARVWSVGGYLLIVDGEPSNQAASVLDPATGNAVATFSPSCVAPGDTPNFTDGLSYGFQLSPVAGAAAVDLTVGQNPLCVQRWDLATGTQTGNVTIEGNLDVADHGLLSLGGTQAWAGGDRGAAIVDLATGSGVEVATEEDWSYRPIGLAGGRVAALGKSSRGTTKYAVAWFDPATGAKVGETPLGSATPGQGTLFQSGSTNADDKSDFVLMAISGDKLILIELKGETKLDVAAVDPATAVSTLLASNEVKTSDIIPEFGPAAWGSGKALVRFGDDNLWTIDLTTGKIVLDFP